MSSGNAFQQGLLINITIDIAIEWQKIEELLQGWQLMPLCLNWLIRQMLLSIQFLKCHKHGYYDTTNNDLPHFGWMLGPL